MKTKKIMVLSLLIMMIFTVAVGCTSDTSEKDGQEDQDNTSEDNNTNEDNDSAPDPVDSPEYINYAGVVSEATGDAENQITVKGTTEESEFEMITFNLTDETVVIDDKTQEIGDITKIKKEDRIEAIYGKDSPMTKGIPPIVNAKALVIRDAEAEDGLGAKVSVFNSDLISKDNSLQISINEDTSIVDLEGNTLNEEGIIDKEVFVLYGPAETLSIPGQAKAQKIILL